MTQILSAKSITSVKAKGAESYEVLWTIPNWINDRNSLDSINSHKVIFETGNTSWFQTKWLVGLKGKVSHNRYIADTAQVYWQLLDIRGTSSIKLETSVQAQLLKTNGEPSSTDEKKQEVSFGEIIEETNGVVKILSDGNHASESEHVHSDGSIKYKLVLTLKTPVMTAAEYEPYRMDHFSKMSTKQMRLEFLSILNHASDTDFKIVASDGVEHLAHKTILRARCPVFAGMLNSDLLETSNGIVKLDDISGDTMNVILHYFYTGELKIGMDACNIVEFTYAAGKYQMTDVLKLLDDMLGWNCKEEATYLDVQLLSLTEKLSLIKAEARLLKRIVVKIEKVKTSEQLFELFGFEKEEILETAEKLADEKLGESYVLEIMDYLLGSTNHVNYLERGLPFLALLQKRSLKMFEKKLLELFACISKKFKSSDELFAVFGHGKRME